VNRDLLWKLCRHYGITDKIVRLLKLIYKNSKAKVRINGELSDSFDIETGVIQGGIPSPVLFNILFDFIIREVLAEAAVAGIQLAYGSNDFFHGAHEKYSNFEVSSLMYADDLIAMCNTMQDLEIFINVFEKITQKYGLTMSVKKTFTMSLLQLKEDTTGKLLNNQPVDDIDANIIIVRSQKVEKTDSFTYLGCFISRDQRIDREIESRVMKATTAFNMIWHVIWYSKAMSIGAKLRIFRACILPVLLYGSEVWCLTLAQENKINTFHMKYLRTLLGLNLGDRMSNQRILQCGAKKACTFLFLRINE